MLRKKEERNLENGRERKAENLVSDRHGDVSKECGNRFASLVIHSAFQRVNTGLKSVADGVDMSAILYPHAHFNPLRLFLTLIDPSNDLSEVHSPLVAPIIKCEGSRGAWSSARFLRVRATRSIVRRLGVSAVPLTRRVLRIYAEVF